MGIHPNAMLLAIIKPDDLSRKTLRNLCQVQPDDDDSGEIVIEEDLKFYVDVMEDTWDEGNQISASVGDIVMRKLVTYGYGEKIEWCDLDLIKCKLDTWLKEKSIEYNFKYKIFIAANYW